MKQQHHSNSPALQRSRQVTVGIITISDRASAHRFHNVELQVIAETRTQFAVACETKLVAAFAEVKVGHCSDEADSLPASRDLVVRGRTVCSKLSFGNQSAITRFDHPLRFINRHEVFVIEHFRCAYRHHLDETEDQVTRRREFYQRN